LIKSTLSATLAISALSLCSCGALMNDLIHTPTGPAYPASHVQTCTTMTRCGTSSVITPGNAYHVARTVHNPLYPVHQAGGRVLAGLLPWYSVGSDPNYQRQATEAYGHMSGHGSIGGYTLQQLNNE